MRFIGTFGFLLVGSSFGIILRFGSTIGWYMVGDWLYGEGLWPLGAVSRIVAFCTVLSLVWSLLSLASLMGAVITAALTPKSTPEIDEEG